MYCSLLESDSVSEGGRERGRLCRAANESLVSSPRLFVVLGCFAVQPTTCVHQLRVLLANCADHDENDCSRRMPLCFVSAYCIVESIEARVQDEFWTTVVVQIFGMLSSRPVWGLDFGLVSSSSSALIITRVCNKLIGNVFRPFLAAHDIHGRALAAVGATAVVSPQSQLSLA